MRIAKRIAKALFLGIVVVLSIAIGAVWFLYSYVTDRATVARWIRDYSVRYLPASVVEPGRVRLNLPAGEVVLHDAELRQQIDGAPFLTLRLPWLSVQFNSRALAKGHLELRQVVVSHPTLRLRRRRDGSWNLQGLLADPWPRPWLEKSPPIFIKNGTIIAEEEPLPALATSSIPGSRSIARASSKPAAGTSVMRSPRPLPAPEAQRSEAGVVPALALFRELSLKIEQVAGFLYRFDGSARSELCDKVELKGTIDVDTGRLTLDGELDGLTISENLRRRIPREARPGVEALALNGGTVDIELSHFSYDPRDASRRCRYAAVAKVREAVWECPLLPFPINDLSALINVEDGKLTIKHAQGSNGQTGVRFWGAFALHDAKCAPLELHAELTDLELDQRLRDHTPSDYVELWDVFKPRGRVDAFLDIVREQTAAPIDLRGRVFCRDVAAEYRHFQYPLDHLTGWLTLQKNTLAVDLKTSSGRPVTLTGLIENPGEDAVVRLDIQAESVPVDETFRRAIPPEVRKVFDQFKPSGLVNGHARVYREPMVGPNPRPEGLIAIDAEIDLTERCEMTWDQLRYPVRDLTGRLEIHPDRWVFKNMRGSNGLAEIRASGSVEKLPIARLPDGGDPLKIDVFLTAQKVPFNDELRISLPIAWRLVWPTINPSGSFDVDAEVHVSPHIPDRTRIVILPRPESNVRLKITRFPQPNIDPGGTTELRLEDVAGRFVFDNGKVDMQDVSFNFRGAPMRFSGGTVCVEDSGRFDLSVTDLWVSEIRFDPELRAKMPPLMSQFALRLDERRTFRARGDLQIGWSGMPGDPAWCRWDKLLVVFNDNMIKTGFPLEHIQGQLDHVSGWSNGTSLEVHGIMNLASVTLLGQQITNLESPFHIVKGVAQLDSIRGRFLGGDLQGAGAITLETTPRYHASLQLRGAQLEEYARTVSGRQSYSGDIDAQITINGLGNDVRNLSGRGEARVKRGNLGDLPPLMRLAQRISQFVKISLLPVNEPPGPSKSAFDSADIAFTISQGLTTFNPIGFTGNAFSLLGQGTLDPQGNLDLRLNVLWGRDRFHIPLVSDFARIASTPFLIVQVKGTPANPQYELVPLPPFNDVLRASNRNRAERPSQ
jgi:hypothetical protein